MGGVLVDLRDLGGKEKSNENQMSVDIEKLLSKTMFSSNNEEMDIEMVLGR